MIRRDDKLTKADEETALIEPRSISDSTRAVEFI